jgi:hypothetical protein
MSTVVTSDRISHLCELLGPAVLLPWPSGSKGNHRKWKHLQITEMNEASHLAKLNRVGNIGVALGRVSNGLVTIDLDEDNYVAAFLAANPLLKTTLRTRASRGCNIWVRFNSEYPPSQRLKNAFGGEIGEWRADGNQTIISGTHPEGMPYQFVVEKPAITIVYGAIIWPESILQPRATESKRVRRVRENEVVAVRSANASPSSIEGFITGGLIPNLAPTDYHQNNASLFKLARLVKTYENSVTRLATAEELEFAFERWCVVARRFWRHARDDYWAEFLEVYCYSRIGLDENPVEMAVSRAKAGSLPDVPGFTDERVRLLAATCREIQLLTGSNPFFLPTRKLGEVLGVDCSRAARWLRALEGLRVIYLAPGEVANAAATAARVTITVFEVSWQFRARAHARTRCKPPRPLGRWDPQGKKTHQTEDPTQKHDPLNTWNYSNGIFQMVRVAVLSSTAAKNEVSPTTFTANPNDPPCAGSTDSCLTNWPCFVNSTISLG